MSQKEDLLYAAFMVAVQEAERVNLVLDLFVVMARKQPTTTAKPEITYTEITSTL